MLIAGSVSHFIGAKKAKHSQSAQCIHLLCSPEQTHRFFAFVVSRIGWISAGKKVEMPPRLPVNDLNLKSGLVIEASFGQDLSTEMFLAMNPTINKRGSSQKRFEAFLSAPQVP